MHYFLCLFKTDFMTPLLLSALFLMLIPISSSPPALQSFAAAGPRFPKFRPLVPALLFQRALLLCLLCFPFKPQEAYEPIGPSALLFTPSVPILPPGAHCPHHNAGHLLCPQVVPSSSNKDESPKPSIREIQAPKKREVPCTLAGISALLLLLYMYYCIFIYYHIFH